MFLGPCFALFFTLFRSCVFLLDFAFPFLLFVYGVLVFDGLTAFSVLLHHTFERGFKLGQFADFYEDCKDNDYHYNRAENGCSERNPERKPIKYVHALRVAVILDCVLDDFLVGSPEIGFHNRLNSLVLADDFHNFVRFPQILEFVLRI